MKVGTRHRDCHFVGFCKRNLIYKATKCSTYNPNFDLSGETILHKIPYFEIILQHFTEVPLAWTQGDNFLGSLLAMDTYFLTVYTVELSPLQGRVEETLPDMSTEGVALMCTSSHELMV